MRILIVGAGAVGFHLAQELANEKHDIAVVDTDPSKIARIKDRIDGLAVLGTGASPATLKQAGIRSADMVIAVTNNDEVNMVTSLLSAKLKAPLRIARVRNAELTRRNAVLPMSDLGIDKVINPDEIAVDTLVNLIETPHATHVAQFSDDRVLLRGFDVTAQSTIVGKPLAELKSVLGGQFVIVMVLRGHESLVPRGDTVLQERDRVIVIMARENLEHFIALIEKNPKPVEKVVIMGATRIGLRLAERLHQETKVGQVILIEPSQPVAEIAADRLSSKIRVLCGEATDPDIATDVSYRDTDFFCALTDDDESNLLGALWAREQGVRRTIILTNKPEYVPLLETIDIDVIINPQLETVAAILQYIRRSEVRKVLRVKNSAVEVIEVVAEPGSKVAGKRLLEIPWPEDTLVGAIVTGGTPRIASGDTLIEPGEKVIMFTSSEHCAEVLSMFSRRTSLLRR